MKGSSPVWPSLAHSLSVTTQTVVMPMAAAGARLRGMSSKNTVAAGSSAWRRHSAS